MLDTLRKIAGIRKERKLPPAGPRPQIGSNIAFTHFRIQLKLSLSTEQWQWFAEKGWRKIDMRSDRRHYVKVADHVVERLILADELEEREAVYQEVLQTPHKELAPAASRRN